MKKLEKNQEYEIRLLPNIDNPTNSIIELVYTVKDIERSILMKRYFCYILTEDNTIDVLVFGKQLKEHIQNCITGYYGTSEGYFICNDNQQDEDGKNIIPTYYYSNDNKSIIKFNQPFDIFDKTDMSLEKYTDVKWYDKIILYDIKSPFLLTCKTNEIHGFMNIFNIGLKETKPFWKLGDDKNIIYDMYKNHIKIDDVIEEYKNEFLTNNPNVLFDDDARKYHGKRFHEILH